MLVSYYQRHGRIRRSFVYSHAFDGSSPQQKRSISDGTIWPWGKTIDTIRYCTKYHDTIRYTVPKRSAVCNGQQSKINAAFSLTRSHAFKRHQQSTAFERCAYPSAAFERGGRYGIRNLALIDFSSVLTNVRTSLTTFERQVHLRLHSSAPSQRICGRRSGTAGIWV